MDGFEPVTAIELGEWLGISDRRVRELDERDVVVKLAPGRYDLRASVAAYCANLREQAAGRASEGGLDLGTERARLAKAQADTAELKLAAMRKDYIPAPAVLAAWQEVISTTKARMLSVPARVKHVSAHLTDEDRDVIDREIRDALTELAHGRFEYGAEDVGDDDIDGVSAGDDVVQAASEDEAVGMDRGHDTPSV